MSEHDTTSDDYRAGYLAGYTDRQGEGDRLENDADRFYRAAYGEERRIPGHYVTRAELEQRRSLSEPPVEVTRRDALASWAWTFLRKTLHHPPRPIRGPASRRRGERTARAGVSMRMSKRHQPF